MKTLPLKLGMALVITAIAGVGSSFADEYSKMNCKDRFAAMDSDKNGQVTPDEFMAAKHPGGKAEDMFKKKDASGDGMLTEEEFCAAKGMGTRMDKESW